MNSQELKRDPFIRHELNQPTSSKLELSIMVDDINLSLGRIITEKDRHKMENTINMFKFLDEKVVEEVQRNPAFGWTSLSEWRSWATGYVAEYNNKQLEEQSKELSVKLQEIARKRLDN